MGWPAEKLQLPDDLAKSILDKKCIAFIGSGASYGCYPSWGDLVNLLCDKCGILDRVANGSTPEEFLLVADKAKVKDPVAYFKCLFDTFLSTTNTRFLYRYLAQLPFKDFITTNFDRLLAIEVTLSKKPIEPPILPYPELDPGRINSGAIFYLHGIVEDDMPPPEGTIVLAKSEFDSAYNDTSSLMHFLIPTLKHNDMCFLGCRLQEPTMKAVFRICKEHQEKRLEIAAARGIAPPLPKRFIVLARPEIADMKGDFSEHMSRKDMVEQEAFYREFDIQVVWYSSAPGDHNALDEAFSRLAKLPKLNILR